MELEEELGLKDLPLTFIGKFRQYRPSIENEICALYLTKTNGPFSGWQKEAENLYWFMPDELQYLLDVQPCVFVETVRSAFDLLKNAGQLHE